MKMNGKLLLLAVLALLLVMTGFSQDSTLNKRHHVALFAPLYLDSAFDAAGNYRYAKNFPKYINPGLEFWEGAQLAIDTLRKEGVALEVHVYDTKSAAKKFNDILVSDELKRMNLIIGHVNVNEAAALAQVASTQSIPFINANLPSEAGVTNNPQYVILSSTLFTHCQGIYKFLQRNYSVSNIVVFRKKGAQEDRLKNYFTDIEKSTAAIPLKLKYVTLEEPFTIKQLLPHLDSNKTNVCLAGSLDATFGQNLCLQLASVSESYATTIMGMPTWDLIDFEKPVYKGIEIYYSTPFYNNPTDKKVNAVLDHFKTVFYSRPTDMVFRGYETLYHFAHLLALHDKNISGSLGDKKYTLFSEFDIQPVLDPKTYTLEYFENKKLYFIKKMDGAVKAVY